MKLSLIVFIFGSCVLLIGCGGAPEVQKSDEELTVMQQEAQRRVDVDERQMQKEQQMRPRKK